MHRNTKDLTGLRFGRLMPIKISDIRGNKNQIRWECICDCGNNHLVTAESLRSGKSKSCGCYAAESRKSKIDRELALYKNLYSHIKTKNKKYVGNIIGFEEFVFLSKQECYYCGEKPSHIINDFRHDRNDLSIHIKVSDTVVYYNGLDRIDSNKGYSIDNVVPCCRKCNVSKLDRKQEDFYKWVNQIYNNLKNKNLI